MNSINATKQLLIEEEDQLRADMYSFLASLLRTEPSADLVKQLTLLESDDTPIGKAIKILTKLVSIEYHELKSSRLNQERAEQGTERF